MWKITGCWHQLAEIHMKGMISVSPDYYIFSYMKVKMNIALLCPTLCDPEQNNGVGSHSLLQGIFPTQGSNPSLPPTLQQILYSLSHQGSPRILESVAYPFSRGSSWPRNQTGVSCIAGHLQILYHLSYQGSPIHRNALNSLTWEIEFSLIHKNTFHVWSTYPLLQNSV